MTQNGVDRRAGRRRSSFAAIAIYAVLAVRRVYGGSLARSDRAGAARVAAIYFVVFTAAMLLTFAIAALRV